MDLSEIIRRSVKINETTIEVVPEIVHTTNELESPEEILESEAEEEIIDEVVEVVAEEIPIPTILTADPTDKNNCSHMCSNANCQAWWSHGPAQRCRYPDLANQGLCPKCLTTDTSTKIPESTTVPSNIQLSVEDFKDGKLSPRAQVFYRNKELAVIKDMNIEQITAHMQFYAQLIEELRARSMQALHKRTELEEEALQDIPEEERAKFIQALRNGSKPKKAKTEKAKKESPKTKEKEYVEILLKKNLPLKTAQVIASYAVKTGNTLEAAEAWFND